MNANRPEAFDSSANAPLFGTSQISVDAYTKDASKIIAKISSLDTASNSPDHALRAMMQDFTLHGDDKKYEDSVFSALDKINPDIMKDMSARYSDDLNNHTIAALKDAHLHNRIDNTLDTLKGTADSGVNYFTQNDVSKYLAERKAAVRATVQGKESAAESTHVQNVLNEKPNAKMAEALNFDPNKTLAENLQNFHGASMQSKADTIVKMISGLDESGMSHPEAKTYEMQRNVLETIAKNPAVIATA